MAYTYTSSATAVATVDATGRVTAVAPGVASITISATGTGTGLASASLSTAAAITVSDRTPGLTTLQVSPTTAALLTGGTQQVTATAQGPRASAASITYGTSAPAIATVNASGLITAVAPGTATITVTAQATQDGAFAASSITGLVTVTVTAPAQVNVSLSGITQGPTVTSYAATATSGGITSANNAQINQPVDAANVRDQIQVTGTLATNGARVDSVVVYVGDAAGANRVSAARQAYADGVAASGNLTLFVNTADFTADFAAGTAAVRFPNGQRQISISAWSGTTEIRAAATQTLAFNNVDGYAASLTAPRSATSAAGLVWHGGPGAAGRGTATIVPVFYTAGRTVASLTVGMRQGALGDVAACGERTEVESALPYAVAFDSSAVTATSTTTDGVIECAAYANANDHVVGVISGTDAAGNTLPMTTYAAGFRTSATVTRPTALRLDYAVPTTTPVNRIQTRPAITGWVNASWNFNTRTTASSDAGVGIATTGSRTWTYTGCGVAATAPVTFTGLAGALEECATDLSATAYTIAYTEVDLLGNARAQSGVSVGVDKTAPLARWAAGSAAADSIQVANTVSMTLTPEFSDARSGFGEATAATGDTLTTTALLATTRSVAGFVVEANNGILSATASATQTSTGARCRTWSAVATNATSGNAVNPGNSFLSSPSCTNFYAPANMTAGLDGWQVGPTVAAISDAFTLVSVSATDRAGNTSVVLTRKVAHRNGLTNTVTPIAPAIITATANPVVTVDYTDDLKALGTTFGFKNGALMHATQVTGGLGTVFQHPYRAIATPFQTPLGSTGRLEISPSTPAPMVTSIAASSTTAGGFTKLTAFAAEVFNHHASRTTGVAMAAAGISTEAATTVPGTVTVNPSVSGGLQAIHTGGSNSAANPFVRVDFYRLVATTDTAEYLGSSSSAVAGLSAGNLATYTYTLTDYAGNATNGVTQRAAQVGDEIIALAVRQSGAATSASAVLGGMALEIDLSITAGVSVPVRITGPNGFDQSVTAGNGKTIVPVSTVGIYTATYPASINTSDAIETASGVSNSVTVSGNSKATFGTITYTRRFVRVTLVHDGLPTGSSGNITLTQAGQAPVVVPFTTTTAGTTATSRTVTLPAIGAWAIAYSNVATTSTNGASLTWTTAAGTVTAALQGTAVTAATATYAQTIEYAPTSVTVPVGVTLTPVVRYASLTGNCTAVPAAYLSVSNNTFPSTVGSTTAVTRDVAFNTANVASVLCASTVTGTDGFAYNYAEQAPIDPTITGATNNAVTYASANMKLVFAQGQCVVGAAAAAACAAGTNMLSELAGTSLNLSVSDVGATPAVTALNGIDPALFAAGNASSFKLVNNRTSVVMAAITPVSRNGATYSFTVEAAKAMPFGATTTYTVTILKTTP